MVDVEVKLTSRQVKKILLNHVLEKWQRKWNASETGRVTFEIFRKVRLGRLQGDHHVNQVLTGHGSFGDHQERFFRKPPECFCDMGVVSTVEHCIYICPLWESVRERFFPRTFRNWSLRTICLDYYCRKGIAEITADLLQRTLERDEARRTNPNS